MDSDECNENRCAHIQGHALILPSAERETHVFERIYLLLLYSYFEEYLAFWKRLLKFQDRLIRSTS